MSQALYRKYRSRSLEEVVGQEHITTLLRRAIDKGAVSHAYLLTGPRGVGKTSIARIIAHEINQLEYSDESNHLDIIEIDAASNNGVEDVRDLRDKIHITPSSASKKIYIIDEVHMLSKSAFNALLKTLEEPPAHVVFILATTDVEKLPATIISRVQQFHFRTIPEEVAVAHLRRIAEKESIQIDDDALSLIAQHGDGSFRDSIGLLDQLRHSAEDNHTITSAMVRLALGASDDEIIAEVIHAYRSGNLRGLADSINKLESTGAYAGIVSKQLISNLQKNIVDHPEDLKVLGGGLLEVSSSSYPYVKLLTVLAANVPVSTAPVTKSADKTPPRSDDTAPIKQKPVVRQAPKPKQAPPSSEPDQEPATESKTAQTKPKASSSDWGWDKLIAAINQDIALKSLLARCGHSKTDETMTIYAGTRFNAEKLTSPKQNMKLRAALEKIGAADINLDIRAEKTPLSDSQTAGVAAIMGGGEEVAYDG